MLSGLELGVAALPVGLGDTIALAIRLKSWMNGA